jgi:hypothetical protein
MSYLKNKRDGNEKEILAFFAACGAAWVPGRPGQGCDGFLLYRGRIHVIEIKMPAEITRLTQSERDLRDRAEGCGCAYNVVTSIQDAAAVLDVEVFGV